MPDPQAWQGSVIDIGSGGGLALATAAAGGHTAIGIEIQEEDHEEAVALTSHCPVQPTLYYGREYDAETMSLSDITRTERCGCYAYLVGVNWWQHVNIGRQVALSTKVDWFIWCTIPEDDLTASELPTHAR